MEKLDNFLLAGNWKMNAGTRAEAIAEFKAICGADRGGAAIELLVCPPLHLLEPFTSAGGGGHVLVGAQDCHFEPSGAFTGDISAEMLAEIGVSAVICGHSERRAAYGETNALVQKKAQAAQRAGLHPIICIGESAEEYEQKKTLEVLEKQVKESMPESGDFTIAYEPIWAIGTGKAAQSEDIARAHQHILEIRQARVLYGGSVSPKNAAEIAKIKEVGGFLIGSASLKAKSFLSIMELCKPFCS